MTNCTALKTHNWTLIEDVKRKDDVIMASDAISKNRSLGEKVEALRHAVFNILGESQTFIALAFLSDSIDRVKSYGSDIEEVAIDHHYALLYRKG